MREFVGKRKIHPGRRKGRCKKRVPRGAEERRKLSTPKLLRDVMQVQSRKKKKEGRVEINVSATLTGAGARRNQRGLSKESRNRPNLVVQLRETIFGANRGEYRSARAKQGRQESKGKEELRFLS